MQPDYPLFYSFNFYLFGLVAIAAAITFITRRSPVAAALWLVVTMFCLAAEYVMLDAHFIGVIQVLVYAGAIMVVFLFVVMLLNLGQPSDFEDMRRGWWKMLAGAVGIALVSLLAAETRAGAVDEVVSRAMPADVLHEQIQRIGAVNVVARPLFNEYLLAFEVTSVLLLAAITGAVVLGRRREGVGDAG